MSNFNDHANYSTLSRDKPVLLANVSLSAVTQNNLMSLFP